MSKSGQENQPDKGADVSAQATESTGLSVGKILKQERESRSLNLTTVAKELMIRKFYLDALEEGRYADLPDTVYASGFVKSYAELLGLEHGPLVSQFKRERGEANQKTDLTFPDPPPESRLPSRGVILGGLSAAAVILFLWASIAGEDTVNELETIPEPPEEVMASPEATAPTPRPDFVRPEAQGQPPFLADENTVTPSDVLEDKNTTAAEITTTPPAVQSESQPEPVSEDAPSSEALTSAAEPETEVAQSPEASEFIAPQMPEPTATPQSEPNQRVRADDNVITVPEPSPPLAEQERSFMRQDERSRDRAVMSRPDGQPEYINPDPNRDSRITVIATEEAWVEIRDRNGLLLLTRVLQPGQRYDVPDEKGVTMITGNAGGVYLMVDGKKTPPLGRPASVKRNIRLDADLY